MQEWYLLGLAAEQRRGVPVTFSADWGGPGGRGCAPLRGVYNRHRSETDPRRSG